MLFNIKNEYSELKSAAYCSGRYAHVAKTYITDDPEFHKFHSLEKGWDNALLVEQQEKFLKLLQSYDVELVELEAKETLPWQMYTRDVAFVIGEKLFYSKNRKFKERNGEFDPLLSSIKDRSVSNEKFVEIVSGQIEGGDVIPTDDIVLVGQSSRTSQDAIDEISQYVNLKKLNLGENIMHLDTRLMILSKNTAIIHTKSFNAEDVLYLKSKYDFIEVTDTEAQALASNVILINPETVVVESQQQRLCNELRQRGYKVEMIDYSEPIAYGGSFRCTTLSLCRQ